MNNKQKLSYIEVVFIIFFTFISINPKMNVMFSMLNYLAIELVYAVYVAFKEKTLSKYLKITFLCSLVLAFLFTFTVEIKVVSGVDNIKIKSFISMFNSFFSLSFPLLMFYRLKLHASAFQKILVLTVLSLTLFIIFQVTWDELAINARLMKSQMEADINSGNNLLVGGYTFVCAGSILATASFYSFLRASNRILKYLMAGVCMFFILFLVKSMYAIAFLSALLGMFACFYSQSSSKHRYWFIISPIIIWFLAPTFLTFLIGMLDDGDTKTRMMEIFDFISTGSFGDDDLGYRMELYGKGMMAFFSSPIWGNYDIPFNPHSTIIEILSSLGLIGGYAFFCILRKSFILLKILLTEWSVIPCLSAFLLMALTNPIHASQPLNISFWLIVPLLYDFVSFVNLLNNKKQY